MENGGRVIRNRRDIIIPKENPADTKYHYPVQIMDPISNSSMMQTRSITKKR